MKEVWVKELKNYLGKEICDVFYLKDITYSQSEGSRWQSIILVDRTARTVGKVWSEFIDQGYEDLVGKLVQVIGKVEIYRDMYIIRVVKINPVDETQYLITDFAAGITESEAESHRKKICEAIQSVTSESYRRLLQHVFTAGRIKTFSTLPADKRYHHSYMGGWLVHVVEVLEIALNSIKVCQYSPLQRIGVNTDLIITGALLHNIGLICSFKPNVTTSLTLRGKLLGSVHNGAIFVTSINNMLKPEERVKDLSELLHIIVSSEENEIKPMTKEAVLISQAKLMSATMSAYDTLFSDYDLAHPEEHHRDHIYSKYFGCEMTRINR